MKIIVILIICIWLISYAGATFSLIKIINKIQKDLKKLQQDLQKPSK